MQIAILLFDRFTVLDAIGPYQVLSGLPGAEVSFVAEHPGPIRDEVGSLVLSAQAGLPDVPHPDIVVVPGGPGQNNQMKDGAVHEWLRTADQTSAWTTSVCTGSLILAAAGLLAGRRATSHWLALDELGRLGATPVSERVVSDGKYVTAAGVSSGIDMALALAGRIAGDETAQAIQLMIEYDPQPPYDDGSPDRAPAEIVRALRARSRFILTGRPALPASACDCKRSIWGFCGHGRLGRGMPESAPCPLMAAGSASRAGGSQGRVAPAQQSREVKGRAGLSRGCSLA